MKNKLLKIYKAIKEGLAYIKEAEEGDWITPDDPRYTQILDEYESKLTDVWDKTKSRFINRVKAKNLDIDDSLEQYDEDILLEEGESDYVDEALLILAEAFGLGVIVGFEEIIARGLLVEIPTNPHLFFDEATEIKMYALAALSYEDLQMNQIFDEYNNLNNAKDLISQWFDTNRYRLIDMVLGGVVWYGINFGFAKAALSNEDDSDGSALNLYWLTEHDRKVCSDCEKMEAGNPYNKDNPLTTLPGGGKTLCGSRCRCVIDTKERK